MTLTVSKFYDGLVSRETSGTEGLPRSSMRDLSRENRWKRRGQPSLAKPLILVLGLVFIGFIAAGLFLPKSKTRLHGLEGSFAIAVYEAFPEADPSKIVTLQEDDLPHSATLELPAYLIEPGQGIGNPFARLGVEFGGIERTLSGVEMASRLEQIGEAVLPADLLRCHSYEIGKISSKPEDRRRTRILHVHLNPGC